MVSVKFFIRAGAATMISTAACAADLPPPPPIAYQPPVVVEAPVSGWYLRGDVGIGITGPFTLTFLQNPLNVNAAEIDTFPEHQAMGDTPFFLAGVGYEWNNWLRFDVTGEYRSKTEINAFGSFFFPAIPFVGGDFYTGFLKSWVFLGNAYLDLGTWNCLTPFIGVGFGGAYNSISNLADIGIGTSGRGIGQNGSNWNFAWAAHAGVAYTVTQNTKLELAYRYLSYGSVTDTVDCFGGCNPDSFKWSKLTSQDLMLGFRWMFPVEPVVAAPLRTRG